MEHLYAKRVQKSGNSDLAELFKLSEQPDIISFAGGFPDPRWFLDEIEEIAHQVLTDKKDIALQYGPVPGFTHVREFVAGRMQEQQMKVNMENILITSGSLQGLDLICRVFLDPGDLIVMEAPTYLGAITTFVSYEAEIVPIPADEDGMQVDQLENFLKNTPRKPKFIYVIPTFQNPTGRVMSLERRKKLIELANEYRVPVIDDNAYGELRFSGDEIPTIKALDTENMVIYLGTFSKIFSPGVRLGWIAAHPKLIETLILFKQGSDQTSSSLSQLLAYEAGKRGLIEKQIAMTCAGLKQKRDLTISALQKYFKDRATWNEPEGGYYVWVQLKDQVDTLKRLAPAVINHKVAYVAGSSFYPDRRGENCLRVCYSLAKESDIDEGIRRLAQAFVNA
ncbi:MAG: PLP-dependent aminotransferase family protein [Peptococcaceae bacterium]|jgi:DNA-binding transcriptional MocR family regulator|nr:PLP-dependent aminotransferase family protein [Peptococcaceae bacterium]